MSLNVDLPFISFLRRLIRSTKLNTSLLFEPHDLLTEGTPMNPLKSRTSNVFWNRVVKTILGNIGGVGVNGYKLSDGRVRVIF